MEIGEGRVQSATSDGTEEAFHRALRPRKLSATMVAGIVVIVALAAAGVTTAHASLRVPPPADPRPEAPRAQSQGSEPPPPDANTFKPEKHVGHLDPETLERLRKLDERDVYAGSTPRRSHRRRDPLQLTR